MPNCKLHAATRESTRIWPRTRLLQGDCLTLVWNWKKILLLLYRALWVKTVEGNFWLAQLSLMPTRSSQIQKTNEHAEKWSENIWTTWTKRNVWEFSPWRGTQASLNSRRYEDSGSQSHNKQRMRKIVKLLAWDEKKVKSKSEVVRQAMKDGKTVHFEHLMDLCHLTNAELAKDLQKYKERVVLWGDNVKDEEGYRAVCTGQGASVSCTDGRRNYWTLSQSFLVWLEKQVTQFQLTVRSRWPKIPDCYDCQKKNVRDRDPHSWDKNWRSCGSSWKEFMWSPISRPFLGMTNSRRCQFEKWMEEYLLVMSLRAQRDSHDSYLFTCFFLYGWEEGRHGIRVERSTERNRPRRSNAIVRSSVFGMHAKRCKRFISGRFSIKPCCSKTLRR